MPDLTKRQLLDLIESTVPDNATVTGVKVERGSYEIPLNGGEFQRLPNDGVTELSHA